MEFDAGCRARRLPVRPAAPKVVLLLLRCAVLGEPAEGWVTVFAVVCALGVFLL